MAGDVGKEKLNRCPDDEELVLGWVWPCEEGGCGEEEEEGGRGDWLSGTMGESN